MGLKQKHTLGETYDFTRDLFSNGAHAQHDRCAEMAEATPERCFCQGFGATPGASCEHCSRQGFGRNCVAASAPGMQTL